MIPQNMIPVMLISPEGVSEQVGYTNHRSGLSIALAFIADDRNTEAVVNVIRERIPSWDGTAEKRYDRVELPGGWVLKHG